MGFDAALIDADTAPYGVLLLRLCLAALFSAHALLEWRVFTIPVEAEFFKSLGLPGWLARDDRGRVKRRRVFAARNCCPLGCAVSHSTHSGHDCHRARKEGLALQQQGRWLGISGLPGSDAVRAVFSRRWPVDPDPLTRFAKGALTRDRPTRLGHAAAPRSRVRYERG